MNDSLSTPAQLKSALKTQIDQHTIAIKEQSNRFMEEMNQAIRSKEKEYEALLRGVNQTDAAQLIVSRIRAVVEPHLQSIEKSAAAAVLLASHDVPVKKLQRNGDGGMLVLEGSELALFKPLSYDMSAWDLLALMWDESAIERFAKRVVVAAGAPAEGKSVAQLAADAERVFEELRALNAERAEAREMLDGIIRIPAHVPSLPDPADAKVAVDDFKPVPSNGPSVTVVDANGNPQPTSIGYSFHELIAIRAKNEIAEKQARIASGEIYDDNGNVLTDR